MEPAAELLVLRQLTLENLYCHEAVEPVAARLVDNSHAARTDDLENFISIVQQRSYVLIHKIAPSLNKRHCDRHIVGAPRFFAMRRSLWQQSLLRTPCATSNSIS